MTDYEETLKQFDEKINQIIAQQKATSDFELWLKLENDISLTYCEKQDYMLKHAREQSHGKD